MHPLLLAAVWAAATDGTYAFRSVMASRASLGSALDAFCVATATTLAPLLLLVILADLVWRRVRPALAIDPAEIERLVGGHGPLAAAILVGSVGFAAVRASIVGRSLVTALSPAFAAPFLVLLVLSASAAALAAGFVAARLLGPRLVALETEARFPWLALATLARPACRLVAILTVAVVLDSLLPREYVVVPVGAVAGFAAAGAVPKRRLVHAVLAFAFGLQAAPHLKSAARQAVLKEPPYGSLVLSAARSAFDRDRDGYSAILGGGDCDDGDPSVHPGAVDVPDDGRDQNCDGFDATTAPRGAHDAAPDVPRAPSLPARPNIVLIVVDALRPDHLGFAGYGRPTSPALDAFRRGATWFRRAYTPAPATRFALSSIFTGLPVEAIAQRRGPGVDFELLPEADTLAEDLERAGYHRVGLTFPYVVNHIRGLGQGFDTWTAPGHWRADLDLTGTEAPLITDAALAALARTPDDGSRPLLLLAHYPCTHAPYVRHDEHDFGPSEIDAYDSALAHCDEQVGRVLSAVDARSDRDRTVVVVLSDHGELLGEHGQTQHGSSMLEPAMRSLLLVRVPGAAAAKTVDAPVMLTDLHAMLLRLAGVPRATTGATGADDGAWDLGAYLPANATTPERKMFLYVDTWRRGFHHEARGVIDGRYKLVRDLAASTEELFDLESDPTESKNLRRRRRDVVARLRAALDDRNPFAGAGAGSGDEGVR